MKIKTEEALNQLTKALKNDKEYYETWKSTIAVSFLDSYDKYKNKTGKKSLSKEDIHIISNDASNQFLKLLTAK